MVAHFDVKNPVFFPPIKTLQGLNRTDVTESGFVSNCGSTVTILHVVRLCSKRLGPPRGIGLFGLC